MWFLTNRCWVIRITLTEWELNPPNFSLIRDWHYGSLRSHKDRFLPPVSRSFGDTKDADSRATEPDTSHGQGSRKDAEDHVAWPEKLGMDSGGYNMINMGVSQNAGSPTHCVSILKGSNDWMIWWFGRIPIVRKPNLQLKMCRTVHFFPLAALASIDQ